MASFSHEYPIAFHVLPLHAAKGLWKLKALLSAEHRRDIGLRLSRRTTSAVDRILGFGTHVHF